MLWYGYCLLPFNPLYCPYVMSNTVQRSWRVPFFFFFFTYMGSNLSQLYVMSNTLYRRSWRVPFFSFFFLFLSCIITASNPCQSYRCPEDSSCYHNDTHFTCVSYAQEGSNRKNGEIFSSTVIFQFSWCWSAIMLWYGYCLLSLNPLFCDIYSSLTPRRWTKLSKTPKVYYICPAGLSFSLP